MLECVGTSQSMPQALRPTRPGRFVGYAGVPHGVYLAGERLVVVHRTAHAQRGVPALPVVVIDPGGDPGPGGRPGREVLDLPQPGLHGRVPRFDQRVIPYGYDGPGADREGRTATMTGSSSLCPAHEP